MKKEILQENTVNSQKIFFELFDKMKSGIAVYQAVEKGKDFVFVDFNKAAEKIEKKSKKNIVGKKVTEVFPSVKDFGLLDIMKKVYKTNKAMHHPISFYKDDKIHGWRDNYVYKIDDNHIVAIYDDLTEQKVLEEKLYQNQRILKKYLDISPGIIVAIDTNGNIEQINNNGAKILGYSSSKPLIGVNWIDNFIPKNERNKVKEMSEKMFKGKIEVNNHFENKILTKKGKNVLVVWHGEIIKDESGKIKGHLSSGVVIEE